jgi:hypothetical protein
LGVFWPWRGYGQAEAISGVQLVDLLFARLDEGIDGGAVAAGHGSENGSVDDLFVGFGGGGVVIEGRDVLQGFFELGFGLGGAAIFLCGKEVDSPLYVRRFNVF